MSALQLPPSQVKGYSPYLYEFTGGVSIDDIMANSPAMLMFMQQNADEQFRVDMYKQGDWYSALYSLLSWGQSEAMLGMGQAAVANYNVSKKLFSPDDAITFGMNDKVDNLPDYDAELSGSAFSPIAALHHSFTGNGTPMWADINNLGLHFEIGEFAVVQDAMMSAMEGTTPFNVDKVSYNTANDSLITAAYLGNITLKLEGQIDKTGDHAVFHGTVKAWNDTYDANPSNHRSDFGEAATAALNAIQTHTGAQSYEIKLVGEIPVQFEISGE